MSDEPTGGFRRGRSYDVHSSEDDEPHHTSLRSSGREMPTSMSSSQLQPSAKYPQPAPRTRSSGQDLSDTRMQSPRDFSNDSKEESRSRDHGSSKRRNLQYQAEINHRCDKDMSGMNQSQDVFDEGLQKYHEGLPKKLENRRPQKNERMQEDSDDNSMKNAPSEENDNEYAPRRRMNSPHHTDHDGYDSRNYATNKEYGIGNVPRQRVNSPHHPDQDSDHDGCDSRRYATSTEYDNKNAPRRRVKSSHHTDQDSDHSGHDFRSPRKEYGDAPKRRTKSPHSNDQDSDDGVHDSRSPPRKKYDYAPRRRMKSPHHTDQDSDHGGNDSKFTPRKEYVAPKRRTKSPRHTDQDSDHGGHDSRRSPPRKEYDYAPRRRTKSPHHTDQDSDSSDQDSRSPPRKEYDAPKRSTKNPHHTDSNNGGHDSRRSPPRRRIKSPHHTDQDSDHGGHDSISTPRKEYVAPKRRTNSPHSNDQDSDDGGHDSRRSPLRKKYDYAPRRRMKSPLHTDQDSDHGDHDSRRSPPRKEYDAPKRRTNSPHHTDQDSDHGGYDSRSGHDSRRSPPRKAYDYAPRRRMKSPHHTDQDSDHGGNDSKFTPRKEYDAPKRRTKSPHHTDQDSDHRGHDSRSGHDSRRSPPRKEYDVAPRRIMKSPHHTDQDSDHGGHDSRSPPRKEYDYAPKRRTNIPYHIDHEPDHDGWEFVPGKRVEGNQRNDKQDQEHYHHRTQIEYGDPERDPRYYQRRQRDQQQFNGSAPQKEDFQRMFERLTIDEKTQSTGRQQHSRGASNSCHYQSHAVPQDKFQELSKRPSTTRQRQHPPSGDVRIDPYHSKPSPVHRETKFSAFNLIPILLKWHKYEASMLQLMETCGLEPRHIRNVVQSNPNLFEIKQETVCLRLKIKICDAHLSNHGCTYKSACNDLHICPKFVRFSCMSFGCTLGHSLDSGHNSHVMKPFMINNIPESQRLEILKLSIPAPQSSLQLQVCYDYNSGKCQRVVCDFLHICSESLVNNLQCPNSSCKLNHNLLTRENCQLLRNHRVDTNESPRDVLKVLRETYPPLFRKQRPASNNRNNSADQSNTYPGGNTGNYRSRDDNITPSNSRPAGTEYRQNISNPNQGNSAQRGNSYSSGETSNSVWSFHYEGNTEIAEICFYSVTSRCRYEDTGCKRLHAKEHYHWQVKERGKGWVNLRKDQVDSLESAYCDPDKDGVKVPSIDPNNCPKGLLKLFGQDRWQADFKSMLMDNPKTNVTLNLRRLCSEDVDGSVKACKNQWYFLDQNNVWIQYGNTDTTKRDFLASNITSNDIERHFIKSPSVPLTFKNSMFLYVLDFGTMMQTNTQTKVSRKVKRRPVPHMQHNNQPKPGLMSKLMSWTSAS